ncbi:MAG: HNH endonuclease [Chlorobiales bacterium]|nr:HNH endonuclease [Chlorobiales bacterium]
MKKLARVPYKLFEIRYHGDAEWVWIIPDDDERYNRLEHYFPLGLHPEFVQFFTSQGRCALCKAPINTDFSTCKCGHPDTAGYHLIIECSDFRHLIGKERLRVHAWRRQQRIKANGGRYTTREVALLLEVQERSCYYCGSPLVDENGKSKFHKDHYEPLEGGGSNSISNIVLACASCNVKKREDSGEIFKLYAKKGLPTIAKRTISKIQRRVWKFHKSQEDQSCRSFIGDLP